MIMRTNRQLVVGTVVSTILVTGCVSKSKYEALEAENQRLQQQVATQTAQLKAEKAQVGRLSGAIKYTVNSDLLFPSGGWEMSKSGRHIIAKFVEKLAPTQQNKLVVNGYTDDAPIGPTLKKKGIASNEELSQKRAENVMEFLISKGMKADLVSAHGYGDANPVAPNTTAKGRAENRRVELTLGGPAS